MAIVNTRHLLVVLAASFSSVACSTAKAGIDDPRIEYAEGAQHNSKGQWKKAPKKRPTVDELFEALYVQTSGVEVEKLLITKERGWCPTALCPPPSWELDVEAAGQVRENTWTYAEPEEWLEACGLAKTGPVPSKVGASKYLVYRLQEDKGTPMRFEGNFVIDEKEPGAWHIGRTNFTAKRVSDGKGYHRETLAELELVRRRGTLVYKLGEKGLEPLCKEARELAVAPNPDVLGH